MNRLLAAGQNKKNDWTAQNIDIQNIDDVAEFEYLRGYGDGFKSAVHVGDHWMTRSAFVLLGLCIGFALAMLVLLYAPMPADAGEVTPVPTWGTTNWSVTPAFRNPVSEQVHSTCANVMLGVQLADAYTTRVIIRNGGYERDPLVAGAVRSDFGAYASAVAANVVARIFLRHAPQVMCYAAIAESAAVANNIRVIGEQR